MSDEPGWTVLTTDDGSPTLVCPAHGEPCHSRAGAWTEAVERYARHTVGHAALDPSAGGALRLADVGTGLGLNLAAALHVLAARTEASSPRLLEVDAFESVRAPLEWAVREGGRFEGPWSPSWSVVRDALGIALARPSESVAWAVPLQEPSGRLRGVLRLHLGDAGRRLPALPAERAFDAIFLDPFSPPHEAVLWTPAFFAALARRLAPGGRLTTYSAASEVRIGLAAVGLAVGAGPRVGEKREGTLAVPGGEVPPFALPDRVQRRVDRRSAVLREALEQLPGPMGELSARFGLESGQLSSAPDTADPAVETPRRDRREL